MIDKRPALIARCTDADDVAAAIGVRPRRTTCCSPSAAAATTAPGSAPCDDGVVIDLSPLKDVEVDPHARTVRVGGGCTWGEVDRATNEHGLADPERDHLDHRRRRPHARRRHRPPDPQVRPDDRQPARGRRGAGRRRAGARERRREPRPVLGDPRRRRQLRRRHLVPVPAARGRHGRRRPDLLAGRAGRRGPRGLPRVPARRPARAERLLRLRHRAAGAAVPRGAAPAQGVRRRLVLRRRRGRTPPTAMAPLLDAAARAAAPRRRRRCRTRRCRARSTRSTRRATSGTGAPTSSTRSPTRRSTIHAEFGAELPTLAVDHAPVPDRRRRPRRRARRDTAWAYRDASWGSVFAGVDPDPANADAIRSWRVDYFEALHPYSAGGAYVNMMMDEGQERVRASYRDNYDRLAQIKADLRPGQPVPRQPEHPAELTGTPFTWRR